MNVKDLCESHVAAARERMFAHGPRATSAIRWGGWQAARVNAVCLFALAMAVGPWDLLGGRDAHNNSVLHNWQETTTNWRSAASIDGN